MAPPFLSVRFDARFFITAAPVRLDPVPDGVEIERAWWGSPSDALDDHDAGGGQLMWPTFNTLIALEAVRDVDEALSLRMEQVEPATPEEVPEEAR